MTNTQDKTNRAMLKESVTATNAAKPDRITHYATDTETGYLLFTRNEDLVKGSSRFAYHGPRKVDKELVATIPKLLFPDGQGPNSSLEYGTPYHLVATDDMVKNRHTARCWFLTTEQWHEVCRGGGPSSPPIPPGPDSGPGPSGDGDGPAAVFGATTSDTDM